MTTADNSENVPNTVPSLKSKNGHNVESNVRHTELVAPDGGWGWMVATASFIAGSLIGGLGMLFSLILEDLLIAMNTTTATASWVPSTQFFLSMLCVPLASAASSRFSIRKTTIAGGFLCFISLFTASFVQHIEGLIATLGVFGGLGFAFTYPPMFFAINEYFDKRRGRVTGILLSGMSFGRFAFTPALQLIIDHYAFRGAMFIASAVMLNVCVCGSILQPVKWHMKRAIIPLIKANNLEEPSARMVNELENPDETATFLKDAQQQTKESVEPSVAVSNVHGSVNLMKTDLQKSKTSKISLWQKFCTAMRLDFTVFQNPCFYIVCASMIVIVCVVPYAFAFLPPLGQTKGYEPLNAAMLLSVMALTEIAGQLVIPWLVDLKLLSARMVLIITSFGFASLLWGLTIFQDYYADVVLCGFGGIFGGGLMSTNMIAVASVLGPKYLPSVMAFTHFIQSFFALIMGPLLGLARDYTGKFETAFIIMSCIQYCSVIIWLLEPKAKRRALKLINERIN